MWPSKLLRRANSKLHTASMSKRYVHKNAKVNLYEVLHVEENATLYDLKVSLASRSIANMHNKDPERARKYLVAYAVLSDNYNRQIYDDSGYYNESIKYDEKLIFTQLENDKPYFDNKKPPFNFNKGENNEATAEISFIDSLIGTTTTVKYASQRQCKSCLGTGSAKKLAPKKCKSCGGSGVDLIQALKQAKDVKCHSCGGEGSSVADKCKSCSGTGLATVSRVLNVDVPPAVKDGDFVKVEREGNLGLRMGEAGDLYVKIKVTPHPLITREDNDLIINLPVNVSTAILGGKAVVPTLIGERSVEIPPGTNPGDTKVLKDCGIKIGQKRGDVIVKFNVKIPNLRGNETKIIRKISAQEKEPEIQVNWFN